MRVEGCWLRNERVSTIASATSCEREVSTAAGAARRPYRLPPTLKGPREIPPGERRGVRRMSLIETGRRQD
jgi:hypothetical protein